MTAMLGDLTSSRLIIAKGILFLVMGLIAAGLLILDHPDLRSFVLLLICIWSFCRFYYFAFYVIQHYVDDRYRFTGLISFVGYLLRRNRR